MSKVVVLQILNFSGVKDGLDILADRNVRAPFGRDLLI